MPQFDSVNAGNTVVIGLVLSIEAGSPRVVFPGNLKDHAIEAKTLQPIGREDVGREVALLFEGGDYSQPLIIGRVVKPGHKQLDHTVIRDGEIVKVEAKERLELRCGKSSIIMTKDGRITLRGEEILSRASGGNRIRGGSIDIN